MATSETVYSQVTWTHDEDTNTASSVSMNTSEGVVHYQNGGEVVWQPTAVDTTQDNGFVSVNTGTMHGRASTNEWEGSSHERVYAYVDDNPGPPPGRINIFINDPLYFGQPNNNIGVGNWKACVFFRGKFYVFSYSTSQGNEIGYKTTTDGINFSEYVRVSLGWACVTRAIVFNNKIVILAAPVSTGTDGGYIFTSSDGETWTRTKPFEGNKWWLGDIFSNGNTVFAVSDTAVYSSTDLENWTLVSNGVGLGNPLCAIYVPGGTYLVINATGMMTKSTDACVTWTTPTQVPELATPAQLGNRTWCCMSYVGREIIIFRGDGLISRSSYGVTWSNPEKIDNISDGNNIFLSSYALGNDDIALAVGSSGTAITKPKLYGGRKFSRTIVAFTFNGQEYTRYQNGDKTDIYDIQYYCYRYGAGASNLVWLDRTSFESPNDITKVYSAIGRVNAYEGNITFENLIIKTPRPNDTYEYKTIGVITLKESTWKFTPSVGEWVITDVEPATSEEDYGII